MAKPPACVWVAPCFAGKPARRGARLQVGVVVVVALNDPTSTRATCPTESSTTSPSGCDRLTPCALIVVGTYGKVELVPLSGR